MNYISFLLFVFTISSCAKQNPPSSDPIIVYESGNLKLIKISEHVYQHISYLQTQDFGKVECNGMIVVDNGEAAVFDTPTDAVGTNELIYYFQDQNITIKSVVATHFHEDCIAGLYEFHKRGKPSYAHNLTIDFLRDGGKNIPQNGFDKELTLQVGNKKVYLNYFGEGHTKDNIVAYFADEKVLFGGCLIKESGAGKGNLEDANENAWSETVTRLKEKYPGIQTVIPGHGKRGGKELLEYTIRLFQ